MLTPLEVALFGLGSVVYLYWLYQMTIALRGFRPPLPLPSALTFRRFAVVVPAHNEERVVGQLLDSLNAQDHPRDRYDVFVSCDACTDGTADVARGRTATVLVRPEVGGGKSGNLQWAFGQIPLTNYDAVLVFDADNLVRPDFLSKMNDFLEAHPEAEAVQGYLDTKNPDDSWVTRVYALSFWYMNRFWQLARFRVGLSIALGGTGELITTPCLQRIGSDLVSLTDDLEFTCRLVVNGGKVLWNPWAVAFDEKPTGGQASRLQRSRWLRGHYWLARRYVLVALRLFLRTRQLQYVDLALHLIVPGRAAMTYATMFLGPLIVVAGAALEPDRFGRTPSAVWWLIWPCFAAIQATLLLVVSPSLRHHRFTLRYVPDIVAYARYGLLWLPAMLKSVIASRNQAQWERTDHTRALTLRDVASDEDAGRHTSSR